ncbi:MAG: deoxyribodipyrimidine photo-lyase [Patescibacteria group bacterium]|nr:MAG: deoxyribodipyrimidine photo-lyase [Patescibacteria group bacterium]
MSDQLDFRIKKYNLDKENKKGEFVLYWVQTGLRIDYNFALKLAIKESNRLNLPLLVYFALKENKYANLRQYAFLKQGILELKKNLRQIGANFLVQKVDSFSDILKVAKRASVLIADFGYLRGQRYWRSFLIKKLDLPVFLVENDTFAPVILVAKNKVPYAFLIKKKILSFIPKLSDRFELESLRNKTELFNQSNSEIEQQFKMLRLDKKVFKTKFIGGETQACQILSEFIFKKLVYYKKFRSSPDKDFQSNLSPYLHFGFISPVKIVYEVLKNYSIDDENVQAFFNELLVWRELARNFVYFERNYDNWKGLPFWSIKTLDDHKNDKRDYVYSLEELEEGKTHDKYWNACQKEMLLTGKMHNYMRMYWAKKVIEWSLNWRQAYKWLVYLNDKYELDGRDPNGYLGIAWSFGCFDRPWRERKIFGKVRYMNEKGLERKFDMEKYLQKIAELEKNS